MTRTQWIVVAVAVPMLVPIGLIGRALVQEQRDQPTPETVDASPAETVEADSEETVGAAPIQPNANSAPSIPADIEISIVRQPIGLTAARIWVSRPVTRDEAIQIGDHLREYNSLEDLRLEIYFDIDDAQRLNEYALCNVFYNSHWDKAVMDIGKAPADDRVSFWLTRVSDSISHATFENGVLKFTIDAERRPSVPEIWYELEFVLNAGVAPIFYDLERVHGEIVYAGSTLAVFRASQRAVKRGAVRGLYPDSDAYHAMYDRYWDLDRHRRIGAMTEQQYDDDLHDLTIEKMSHYEAYFVEMAGYGARLEIIADLSREIPRDFRPW